MSSQIIELSHLLGVGVQIYPGDTAFDCRLVATTERDGYNVRALSLGSHTGTHIDAPFHFFADGRTIEQIALSELIGPAVLIDLSEKGLQPRQKITWADLEPWKGQMKNGSIVLLNTGWSKRYWKSAAYYDHPYFSKDAAEGIWATGVRVVGFDTLNPDETPINGVGGNDGFGFHEVILGRSGIIAENLTNLEALAAKNTVVSLIPLNLAGSDGSPVRAFAVESS
ncbi:putative cyclase [Crucibulum laeve]|uniref:Putative cyclase n=1 Tax=Crucibulum laeve TaxID=68775 RepID=A0A5C3MJF6_9AGAR|nr:putative cyclase [Crucibulum laeve]